MSVVEAPDLTKGEPAKPENVNIEDSNQIQSTNPEGEMPMATNETSPAPRRFNEKWLAISAIKKRDAFRTREKEDEANIESLRVAFLENKIAEERGEKPIHQIPLIVVLYDPRTCEYILLGGYHRLEAAIRAGLARIRVRVFHGSESEAFQVALDDNNTHGLRLCRGDLRYTIEKMLRRDPEQGIRAISRALKCAASYVSTIANRLRQEELSKSKGEDRVQEGTEKPPKGRGKKSNVVPEKSVEDRKKAAFEHLENLIDDMSEQDGADFLEGYMKRCDYMYQYRSGKSLLENNSVHEAMDQSTETT